jgi:hypothetical protein
MRVTLPFSVHPQCWLVPRFGFYTAQTRNFFGSNIEYGKFFGSVSMLVGY